MPTHTIVTKYVTEAGVVNESTVSTSADGLLVYSGTVSATATQEIDLAFDNTKVKAILVSVTGSPVDFDFVGPDQHIHVAAGGSYTWSANGPAEVTSLIADPVTSISAHNTGSSLPANIEIRILLDVTP